MTLGPETAQLAWTSGHGSPNEAGAAQCGAGARRREQPRHVGNQPAHRAGASGPDTAATGPPNARRQQTGLVRRSNERGGPVRAGRPTMGSPATAAPD